MTEYFISDCTYGDLVKFANEHYDEHDEFMYEEVEIYTIDKLRKERGPIKVATVHLDYEGYEIGIIEKDHLDSKEMRCK